MTDLAFVWFSEGDLFELVLLLLQLGSMNDFVSSIGALLLLCLGRCTRPKFALE